MTDGTRNPTVREVMTPQVATLKVADHLDLAHDVMTLGRIRHMPVLAGERVVGIALAARSLPRRGLLGARVPPGGGARMAGKIRVAEVMTAGGSTADPDWPMRHAVMLMLDKQIGCLPVVDARPPRRPAERDRLPAPARSAARARRGHPTRSMSDIAPPNGLSYDPRCQRPSPAPGAPF